MSNTEFYKQLRDLCFLYSLKRIVNDTIDKNGCLHGKDGKYKSKKDIDINYSWLNQILKMTELDITEAEFMNVVDEVNDVYNAKYKNKNIIVHSVDKFIYKMNNKGFNNYEFTDKMDIEEYRNKNEDWKNNDHI